MKTARVERVLPAPGSLGEVRQRYRHCYDRIAQEDLIKPLEGNKEARNIPLLRLIGDVRAKKVLDVGSAQGLLMDQLKAGASTVCVDLGLAYLRVAREKGHHVVAADGEVLPFRDETFDVVICSGVLEHVLDPEAVVGEVERILAPEGRFFVLVPWEEDLEKYSAFEGTYEFTHLRSFNDDVVRNLFRRFHVVQRRGVEPKVEKLPHRKILDSLPGFLSSFLSGLYRLAWVGIDYLEGRCGWKMPRRLRDRYWAWYWGRLAKLPEWDRLWLWFYPPFHMIFELKPLGRGSTRRYSHE